MNRTIRKLFVALSGAWSLWALTVGAGPANETTEAPWATAFDADPASMASVGRNPYIVLEPGHYLVLRDGSGNQLTMTVLDETKKVAGVETRVIEEYELARGKLVEISRNYFAIHKTTHDVLYFGEQVSMYKNGKVVSREGSWLAGVDRAKAGLMMPGEVRRGYRHFQEQAPEVAMDRAEILGDGETVDTPAGKFEGCLKVEETSALSSGEHEYKYYAPGVGLVKYEQMLLVEHGIKRTGKRSSGS